ncbi:hypothetical protein P4493_04470 [Bacillus thuringiensis]|uniref:Uncharacterized protein n=4 Tax=Bacillus thuringiensis TaxID=1428 RepID=A0A0B5NIX8_BACTU|nr:MULTISPECIES: hypothetical protein [Bacillus]MEC2534453.1 hypothetical protein [Bacillus cereus]MED1153754.1 hypothetical protein [Bacillus paranthracis]OUB09380.1 hypothetical protein BK708_33195 [Bacillus thuringiensis serovar yunnanensis]AFQ30068.1 hypothetical protein BTF1_29837 [Bacillus thuringiensis HD-789]AJG73926.1 hypothetical protein BF38_5868 [Bacillus thuringiensis]
MGGNQFQDAMRPKKGERVINLPITFSKRSEGTVNKTTLFWVIAISTVLFLIYVYGVLTGSKPFYYKIPLALLSTYVYTFILRFLVFQEGRISDAYETMVEKDYEQSTNAFWNIYNISPKPPFTVHYANGLKGIFVRLDKDVVVGQEDNMEFTHFEKLADMYNVAHRLGLDMVNIDYMDIVGNDSRMQSMYAKASNCENESLKQILLSMCGYLEYEMSLDYTSYDVYLFTGRISEEALFYNVREVLDAGMYANYKSYTLIDPNQLRNMTQSIMNLENFSRLQAEKEVIMNTLSKTITPIKLIREDGTEEIYNKTRAQLEEDKKFQEAMKAEEKRKKKESKNKKSKTSDVVKENKDESQDKLGDFFESTTILDDSYLNDEVVEEVKVDDVKKPVLRKESEVITRKEEVEVKKEEVKPNIVETEKPNTKETKKDSKVNLFSDSEDEGW